MSISIAPYWPIGDRDTGSLANILFDGRGYELAHDAIMAMYP